MAESAAPICPHLTRLQETAMLRATVPTWGWGPWSITHGTHGVWARSWHRANWLERQRDISSSFPNASCNSFLPFSHNAGVHSPHAQLQHLLPVGLGSLQPRIPTAATAAASSLCFVAPPNPTTTLPIMLPLHWRSGRRRSGDSRCCRCRF